MKTIAITPVFNEENVIISVLDRIKRHVDLLIVSNDGSTDETEALIEAWRQDKQGVYVITARKNGGASMALKKGYALVAHLLNTEVIEPADAVVEIDSDGQHDPDYIPSLVERFVAARENRVILARRGFSNYPFVKVWGNRFLTAVASVLSGTRYHDVESNYRVMAARVFPELIQYFWGYRYSGAFEVGIILGRLGYQTDNTFVVNVPYYRAGSRAIDGFHVVAAGIVAWAKVVTRRPHPAIDEFLRGTLSEVT
ncbi:MAG: glycosyltransferase family 2 protein [Vicinamibacterales bacterium]|nr:glycosyltransferase family 2 protein [Vicinamibacterales bacterium]